MSQATEIYQIKELTPKQKEIIKATIPTLEAAGTTLTTEFYKYLISSNDEVKPFFNQTDQKLLRQPKILAFALLNYAKNIDDLAPLTAFVQQIVLKHVGLQVQPNHYPIVGGCLLETMKKLLGETASEEFLEAWGTAYGNLAQILINAEHAEYLKNLWQGFKEFKVTKIENESSNVKSVYFTPADGSKISLPKRGQYVAIRWLDAGDKFETSREYSLSQYPTDNQYRISVRHLKDGKISTYIHDKLAVGSTIKVAPPAGNFVYDDKDEHRSVVLFAGGIGITPLLPIAEYALGKGRAVTLLNSNVDSTTRPFGDKLKELGENYPEKFQLQEFFSAGKLADSGKVTASRLLEKDLDFIESLAKTDYYLIGPREYMKFVRQILENKGIEPSNIRSEFYGPVEV